MTDQDWISTGKANRIFGGGIDDRTFRDKFRGCIPNKLTPGGHFRWLRSAVEKLKPSALPKAS